jgi:hypothetical protein
MQKNIQLQFPLKVFSSVQLNKKISIFKSKKNLCFFKPISEARTNPETDIPRVEQARRNLANTNITYDPQNPNDFCGPNEHKKLDNVIKIKLILIIGRRPYLSASIPNTIDPTI